MLANSGIGKVYFKFKNYDRARFYLNQALTQAEVLSNIEGLIISEFYLGRVNFDEGSFENALKHFDNAFDIATEHSRKHDMSSLSGLDLVTVLYTLSSSRTPERHSAAS